MLISHQSRYDTNTIVYQPLTFRELTFERLVQLQLQQNTWCQYGDPLDEGAKEYQISELVSGW